jgi:hypothetical protein
MATTIGYITRTNNGELPYTARSVNNLTIGNYQNLGDAKREMGLQCGAGNKIVKWTRDDLGGSVESYIGELP